MRAVRYASVLIATVALAGATLPQQAQRSRSVQATAGACIDFRNVYASVVDNRWRVDSVGGYASVTRTSHSCAADTCDRGSLSCRRDRRISAARLS